MPQSTALPVLVVGGGVAGMRAALDLANLGLPVRLVEKDEHLGGQAMRLDKLYPTDHCAFCPTWTQARACREHPLIRVETGVRFEELEESEGAVEAVLTRLPRPVDPELCVFCGQCMAACPQKALGGRPADLPWDPSVAPRPHLDATRCDGCGTCVPVCPTGALDPARPGERFRLAVSDCIFAGGFFEPVPAPAPEFGAHSHPDILTAMAFEAWSAEFRADPAAALLCPSDKRPAASIAFIQCAGARDRRHLPQCSAVCCMHAAKQAAWMKRRQPELELTVFYTDLRAPGKGQEAYMRAAADAGVRLVRRRPGLVAPFSAPGERGIAVRHEHLGDVVTTLADIVVLNGALTCCPRPDMTQAPVAERFRAERLCGFCSEPADIAFSVVQAGHAAALLYRQRGIAEKGAGS